MLQIGASVLLIAVATMRLAPALLRWERGLRARVANQAAVVARQEAAIRLLPTLEDSAVALRRALVALAPRLVSAGSPLEASAELSNTVRGILDGTGASVDRITPVPDSASVGDLHRSSVTAGATMDAIALEAVLRRLATLSVVCEVAQLRVVALDPMSGPAAPERLQVEMLVHAWFLAAQPGGRR